MSDMSRRQTAGGQYDGAMGAIVAFEGWGAGDAVYLFQMCEDCDRWIADGHGGGAAWRYVFPDRCQCDEEGIASFLFDESADGTPSAMDVEIQHIRAREKP